MRKKTMVFWSLAAAAAVAGGAAWKWKRGDGGRPAFKPVRVERGDISVSVSATGAAQPQNRLELKPSVAGRIESILVDEGDRVRKGQVLAWLSSTERAALLDAARAQGAEESARWEKAYRPTPMVAPMDGVVIARNMEPGQTVAAPDVPIVMSDRLIIKAQVDETDIGRLRPGLKTEIVLDAYPERKWDGSVDRIAYEAKTVNNVTVYEVDVLPGRAPALMRSGMTANVTFVLIKKDGVLTVPQEAVRAGEKGAVVRVPSADGKPGGQEERPVRTGISDGKRVEVLEGLSQGETVLVADMKWKRQDRGQAGSPFSPFSARPARAGRQR